MGAALNVAKMEFAYGKLPSNPILCYRQTRRTMSRCPHLRQVSRRAFPAVIYQMEVVHPDTLFRMHCRRPTIGNVWRGLSTPSGSPSLAVPVAVA